MAKQKLSSKLFHNHIKLGLGYLFAKDVLCKFVCEDTKEFTKQVLNNQPVVSECHMCRTSNLLECPTSGICNRDVSRCRYHSGLSSAYRICPNGICDQFKRRIESDHRSEPAWRNTDATKWCTSEIEVVKCFMPEKGYDAVALFCDIDFHGMISVLINNQRFQNKLSIQQSQIKKIRQINNDFRHSANLSLEDRELMDNLDLLIGLLEDPKHLNGISTAAVETLKQLKTNTFEISSTDISKVLTEAIIERESAALQNVYEQKDQSLTLLKELYDRYKEAAENVTADSLAEIIDMKMIAVLELTEKATQLSTSIMRTGNREQRKLHRTASQIKRSFEREEHTKQDDHILLVKPRSEVIQEFRNELIDFYKEEHKYLPISPMIDTNKAPLLHFYVTPAMYNIDVEKQPYRNEESKFTRPVKSYDNIFFKDNKICKNIYVTSRAGSGKTCFSKRMTLAWCQAWSPEASSRECFEIENTIAMKRFSFLFHLSLRACLSKECDIDEIIYSQLISKLSKEPEYKQIINHLLSSEECLIIIDGLDEWSHPTKKKKRCKDFRSKIPHRKFRKQETYLTTSRRWKFQKLYKLINMLK